MADDAKRPVRVERSALAFVRLHPLQCSEPILHPGPEVSFTLGPRSGRVFLFMDPSAPTNEVTVSSAFADQLRIRSFADRLYATITTKGISFHSLIGILCNPIWQAKNQGLRPTKQLPILQKLCAAASSQRAVAFVFGLRDVDLRNMKVKGYRYTGKDWSPDIFPLPNVIYDQIVSRREERRKDLTDRRAELSSLYLRRLFNDGFLDKWQVNEWLQSDVRTKGQVPETIRYTNLAQVAKFVAFHGVTYCKPVHGSLGRGIMRIEKVTDGSYEYTISRVKDAPLKGREGTALDALRPLSARLKSRPYVVQQGIPLQHFENRPFDIRIVLQRDGTGEWMRTKMFARVADEGQITSNLSSGGEALPVPTVLAGLCASDVQRRRIMTAIRRLSRTIPEVLETASGKQFGELGIDIGIDTKGTLWIIEVNSKPWKTAKTDRGRKDLVDLSFARPMQYAVYLAEQQE
jgi:glutathione synthase/RimK-type ligase-like ATP-grasp enzyme